MNHPLPLPFALTSKSSPQRSDCWVSSGLVNEISMHGDPCMSSFSTRRLTLHCLPAVCSLCVYFTSENRTKRHELCQHFPTVFSFVRCLPICARGTSFLHCRHRRAQLSSLFSSNLRSTCARVVSFLTGDGRVAPFLTQILEAGRGGADDGEVKKRAEQYVSLQQHCPSPPLPPQ